MIISAAIISKEGQLFCPDFIPCEYRSIISKHANSFLYALGIEDDDVELPYIETSHLRYVYKQTENLYWILVTNTDSDLMSDVNLLGKFVCTIMEYGSSETNSDTLTHEQRDLYYRHIWRPWDEDPQCPTCGRYNITEVWNREFNSRVQYLISMRDGHIDDSDVSYFNALISESWAIREKLYNKSNPKCDQMDDLNSESDSVCSSETKSISEEIVIDGCRLTCRLEDIRIELKRIQDPYLRLFARRDLLVGSTAIDQACSAPSFENCDFSTLNETA